MQGTYEDGCLGIAKGAAYSAVLAFFPVITTIATILVQANADAVARTIARLLYDIVPPGTEDIVRALFNVHGDRPTTLIVTAIILAAWAGSGVLMSLLEGFRAVYRIPTGRSFVRERIVALALVFVAAIPMLAASGLIVAGNRARNRLIAFLGIGGPGIVGPDDLRGWVLLAGQILSFAIAFGTIVLITTLVYYFGPNRRQHFWRLFPGAILATILWMLATLAVGWYVSSVAKYSVLYGGVGAGLALLVWSYVLAVVMLFGCEFNAAAERHRTYQNLR
jgi:membrane protein